MAIIIWDHEGLVRGCYVDRMQLTTGIVFLSIRVIGGFVRGMKAHATVIINHFREDSKRPIQSLKKFCLAFLYYRQLHGRGSVGLTTSSACLG